MKLAVVLLLLIASSVAAQTPAAFTEKVKALRSLLTRADTISSSEAWGSDYSDGDTEQIPVDVNSQILNALVDILSTPEVVRYNLDSLLKHPFLGVRRSEDRRLWILDWFENTGGTFQSFSSIVFTLSSANKPKLFDIYSTAIDSERTGETRCVPGAGYTAIDKLKSDSNLYLLRGGGVGCSTCCFEFAEVARLIGDSVSFDYPAFVFPRSFTGFVDSTNSVIWTNDSTEQTSANSHGDDEADEDATSCFSLDSRCGDIEQFTFFPETQTLAYKYTPDDMTPVTSEVSYDDHTGRRIEGRFVFNGKQFIPDER